MHVGIRIHIDVFRRDGSALAKKTVSVPLSVVGLCAAKSGAPDGETRGKSDDATVARKGEDARANSVCGPNVQFHRRRGFVVSLQLRVCL